MRKYVKTFESFHNSLSGIISEADLNREPKFLYHLTDAKHIENIKNNGLHIDSSIQHKYDPGVYLTDSLYVAENYRYLNGELEDYFVIEIPFNTLEKSFMKPDDDEFFDIIEDEWPEILEALNIDSVSGNEKVIWNALDYRYSLFICNQILYTQNITPDHFSRILNKEDLKSVSKIITT